MLRIILAAVFITVAVFGAFIIAIHSPDTTCTTSTMIVGGQPYLVTSCK